MGKVYILQQYKHIYIIHICMLMIANQFTSRFHLANRFEHFLRTDHNQKGSHLI
uniref:Uncharacterized protein n=1 Tax=Human betaherpesvirus 6 TaxID=10368 RepID=A0A5P9S591_9BETA|nr:hypothetical protein [Human betaherpesvirus 6]